MIESKFVVFQMIPHTLFIEWDFRHCSLAVSLFMTLLLAVLLYTSRLALFMALFTSRCEVTVHIYGTVHVYGTVHIYGTIHTTSFFFLNFYF